MRIVPLYRSFVLAVFLAFALPALSQTQSPMPAQMRALIDEAAEKILDATGVPSASIAVVRDGRIAYVHAYGCAKLDSKMPANTDMRYRIGSISKQFTATAVLILQQQGKLSLNDPVGKYLPGLTRANEVTIRELLSHTSGYQDYWPQDYVFPAMLKGINPQHIVDVWGHRPLDFDPGTKWQYSNTNYVIAGMIIQKVTGGSPFDFLAQHVFRPLGMKGVYNNDQVDPPSSDPTGYIRYALGPLHPAPVIGHGWVYAAGELSMTAEDLATWDLSIINRSILGPASYDELEKEVLLKNGVGTRYALGLDISQEHGHWELEHGGEVSGFVSSNAVYPDDRAAIVVLTNQDASSAADQISQQIAKLIFEKADANAAARTQQARDIFEGLQHGKIDRSLFTSDCNAYFDDEAIKDFQSSLGPMGKPSKFTETEHSLRGGMTLRVYRAVFPTKALRVWTYEMPDGRLEQYQVAVAQ